MVIKRKSSINKKYYELSGQMSFFGKDSFNFKTVTLAKAQRYVNICRKFKLKKLLLQKNNPLPFIEKYKF
tara:strand:+ start:228 stop:437 length:210 start_codon:yes stop_codon:yes gene_type:complete